MVRSAHGRCVRIRVPHASDMPCGGRGARRRARGHAVENQNTRRRGCAVAVFRIGTLVLHAPAPPAAGGRTHRFRSVIGRFGTHVA
ncbi:hypothetical protein WT12_17065 [Burkholderia territorii]|nr:hypothetical protein WT12_17065 [Burkholderia territorii]